MFGRYYTWLQQSLRMIEVEPLRLSKTNILLAVTSLPAGLEGHPAASTYRKASLRWARRHELPLGHLLDTFQMTSERAMTTFQKTSFFRAVDESWRSIWAIQSSSNHPFAARLSWVFGAGNQPLLLRPIAASQVWWRRHRYPDCHRNAWAPAARFRSGFSRTLLGTW